MINERKFSCFIPLLVAAFACGAVLRAESEAIKPDAPIVLFNGKDLSGFYTWLVDDHHEDPLRVFTVVDQVDGAPAIRISGQRWGGIVTRNRYRDYHLIVEFRWGLSTWGQRMRSTRDSGVLVHCQGPDGNTRENFNGAWMRSVEAQIIQGGVGDFILIQGYTEAGDLHVPEMTVRVHRDRDNEIVYDPEGEPEVFKGARINWYGRDPDWVDSIDYRGSVDVESPVGEWTRLEVICKGNEISNIVNGRLVNHGYDSEFSEGHILIQSEGAEIYFRRIELRPLD